MSAGELFELRDELVEMISAQVGPTTVNAEEMPFVAAVRTAVEQLLTDYVVERKREQGTDLIDLSKLADPGTLVSGVMPCTTEPTVDHAAAAMENDDSIAPQGVTQPTWVEQQRARRVAGRQVRNTAAETVIVPIVAGWAHACQRPEDAIAGAVATDSRVAWIEILHVNAMPGGARIQFRVSREQASALLDTLVVRGVDADTALQAWRAAS